MMHGAAYMVLHGVHGAVIIGNALHAYSITLLNRVLKDLTVLN